MFQNFTNLISFQLNNSESNHRQYSINFACRAKFVAAGLSLIISFAIIFLVILDL